MLTAVARDRWNFSAVFKFCFCFVFVSGNIEIFGKQNSLFPSRPVIKCLILNSKQTHDEYDKQVYFLYKKVERVTMVLYHILYNNQIKARALIGQSAVVNCASKPKEKSRVF